jgi:integrase
MDLAQKFAAEMVASGVSMEALAAAFKAAKAGADAPKKDDKLISTQAQAERAWTGVRRVKNAVGLYLKKDSPGAGSWVRRYWFNGKRRWMGLGALKAVPLKDALKKAREFDTLRDEGKDPLVLKRSGTRGALVGDTWTFKTATLSYLKAHAPAWKHPRAEQVWRSPIEKYAFPVIGDMPLDDIEVWHVNDVMTRAVDGGAPAVADRIRLRIEQILNAAITLKKRNGKAPNPASIDLIKTLRPMKGEKRENFRRIALDDAPAAFRKVAALAANSTMLSAFVFQISTAARPSEALQAQWSEIDLDKGLWTVPAVRMKGGKEHIVPLSPCALSALERQAKVRVSDAVFPGQGGAPISYGAFSAAARGLERDHALDVGTPHSWRSIFRDAAEDRCGFQPHTAEAALAHSLGKVEGAYRRETAVETRRGLMTAYANWLTGEGESNVVTFKRA